MRYKHLVLALVAVAALALMPSAARADNVSFNFTPSTYVGSSGSVVTLFGTFVNGPGAITFQGWADSLQTGLSPTGAQPFDSLVGMAGSTTLGPVALFNVLIDPGVPNGTVFTFAANQFLVTYQDSTGNFVDVAANFSITVRNQAPGVPEPASLMLLGTGLAGVAASLRKRWRSKA